MAEKLNRALIDFVERYGPLVGEEGPVLFVREVLGVELDMWQERVLRAFGRGERRISIRSCHGPGKTAVAAWCILYMLLYRFPQKTIATAPTASQIYDALYMEVLKWYERLPEPLRTLFEVKSDRIELLAARQESFFSARTSRAEKPEAMQGIHSEHVLLVADEASGVPESIFEAAAGSMSGDNATTLLLSNPVRTSGFFFDTHHKLRDMWFTTHVSHADSERVTEDFTIDIAARYGGESNAFRVRCLGEFPTMDDDTIIPFELVEAAVDRDVVAGPTAKPVWGVDVARFGDDISVCLERRRNIVSNNIQSWRKLDLMSLSGQIKARWDSTLPSERPEEILIDSIGLGAGVVDRLRELSLPVRGVNVSESPAIGTKYRNLRTELWFRCRQWLSGRDCKLPKGKDKDDPQEQLVRELVVPRYSFTSTGKMLAEAKDDMKRRGHPSPNFADALMLTFASDAAVFIHGVSLSSDWNEPITRNRKSLV